MLKKQMSLEKKTNMAGYLFLLPWIIGVLFFFIIPFIKSVMYSFSDVTLDEVGLNLKFVGLDNFKYMLLENSDFNKQLTTACTELLTNVPLICFFSLFIAILLNQKFVGRTFMRIVFFLPLIIGAGAVINIINNDVFVAAANEENSSLFQATFLTSVLEQLNISGGIADTITKATSQIFDLSWQSGLQILLYLSSLQTIPQSYYEVASVEGANKWCVFWKITFPVLAPTTLLVVVYTIIDTFTDYKNPVMRAIVTRIEDFLYGYASAAANIFLLVIVIILLLVFLCFRKAVRLDENG